MPSDPPANAVDDPEFAPAAFLDLARTVHTELFAPGAPVWAALARIAGYLQTHLRPAMHGRTVGRPFIGEQVFVGENTVIEPGAMIKGPAWIGANCEIRHGCYVRENVIVGDGAVLGNSCEFKNCVLFDGAQVPHFNYVGDSVLGHKAHLGAGAILSNVRLDHGEILVETPGGQRVPTGLRKFGAILGDHAEVGCNAVLNPGSVLGRRAVIYPGAQWRGVLPADSITKTRPAFSILARHGK